MAAETPKFKPLEFPSVPNVPTRLDYRYCRAMDRVFRWGKGVLTPSIMPESNLDHMSGMYRLLDEIKLNHPEIVRGMDLPAVGKMIYVHDGGEWRKGDLVLSRTDHSEVVDDWKQGEEQDFYEMIERIVRKRDPQLAEEAIKYYRRYVHYDPNDKEAVFTHLLDKIQAVRFGIKYVYTTEHAWGKSEAHSSLGLDKLRKFAVSLSKILDEPGRASLNTFIRSEIGVFFQSLEDNILERWDAER